MIHLEHLATQINLLEEDLCVLLKSLSGIMTDRDYIKQLLEINDHITAMSADN